MSKNLLKEDSKFSTDNFSNDFTNNYTEDFTNNFDNNFTDNFTNNFDKKFIDELSIVKCFLDINDNIIEETSDTEYTNVDYIFLPIYPLAMFINYEKYEHLENTNKCIAPSIILNQLFNFL